MNTYRKLFLFVCNHLLCQTYLKTYFISKGVCSEEILKNLDQISEKAFECHFNQSKQSKITDFFSK
jgi:hypothetical protein